ncbi:hypothetical protein CDD82_427 [Ophiocordyceps australis]|uniref:Phosphatidate phosphatase APP1 catalytic domain-containing protein n=1 Tax=Ophiocordyceps australis TaxID=1399860 RepID=A0A2C5YZD6_9HYPO|nr:hypothetical protein CDD82_427 [Ophiocordyceps australis]
MWPWGHGRHRDKLARFFFKTLLPRAVHDRYRERLIRFHLNTLPRIKHGIQSRIYRFILERQGKRKGVRGTRLVDLVARYRRHELPAASRNKSLASPRKDKSMSTSGYLAEPEANATREYGRRRRLAAMAGSLYRSGQQAVTEIRESYAQVRAKGPSDSASGHGMVHIPGAFPDVAIAWHNEEQMILFPSYAKRHVKAKIEDEQPLKNGVRDEEYWHREWEKAEDEKAIVDVNVHGWVYSSPTLPLSRRNRMLIGLARQLSGIAVPRWDSVAAGASNGQMQSNHQINEAVTDQQRIAREAARIEEKGQEEKRVAYRGGYSEQPTNGGASRVDSLARDHGQPAHAVSAPSSPVLAPKTSQSSTDLSEAELAAANSNLIARIAPFMTSPLIGQPMTVFFYNDRQSQSRTVETNDAGHFVMQAALDFVPTHMRVLANEQLSASQQVSMVEPSGVSLISDVDDTVKHSNISAGAREIFRNTFVRELDDLMVEGVREWYGLLQKLGVGFHYCSNSPWQLFPVLSTFFSTCGLPPGSLHLKQYSGMLQGIFEPVAERKRSTLDRLMRDFPERKFLLVGDSGEADLEVYTELALANPGRVLAIFIRDVTTPEKVGYFDSSFELSQRRMAAMTVDDEWSPKKTLHNKTSVSSLVIEHKQSSSEPLMGPLIDLAEESDKTKLDDAAALEQLKKTAGIKTSDASAPITRKVPPLRPVKPAALRSLQEPLKGTQDLSEKATRNAVGEKRPPLPERRSNMEMLAPVPTRPVEAGFHGPFQAENAPRKGMDPPPPPPPPRRRMARKPSPRPLDRERGDNNGVDVEPTWKTLTKSASRSSLRGRNTSPARSEAGAGRKYSRSGTCTPPRGPSSPALTPQGGNKKLEVWRRRLLRAQEQLDGQGVALYTWRRGQDVVEEAAAIVQDELQAQGQGN